MMMSALTLLIGFQEWHPTCKKSCTSSLHGDQTRWEEIFYKVNHTPTPVKKICDIDADAWSVCDG